MVIIGAGAVGTVSALECLRAGHRVTVVDPGAPGGEQASSYGNAGWLSSHSVIPRRSRESGSRVPSYLADPLGPLAIRWRYLPRVLPWLVRYICGGRSGRQIAEDGAGDAYPARGRARASMPASPRRRASAT